MVRRAADEHLPAPHFMASEFEPQNTTPLPIPPTPAAPPRYIHIPTHPSRSPSLRTSLFSFIILQSSLTMLTPARLPLPPAPSTPRNARNEHTVTPPVGQRSPSHHPPPPTQSIRTHVVRTHLTHPGRRSSTPSRPFPPTLEQQHRKRRYAGPAFLFQPPHTPLHTHIPCSRPSFSHSPSGRVPASSGERFRPLPALGHQQFTEPSHKLTTHGHQPSSQTNPPAGRDTHHHHRPQNSKCHLQNSHT